MAVKKTVKKAVVAPKRTVASVENKVKSFAKNVEKEAKDRFGKETKEISSKIGTRWEVSTSEEKMFTIIGILLLILGIYYMRQFIGGMLLIVIGLLFVTGFFLKRKK
ncbi:MAG: hypothetical protein ACD_80C00092G0003 [uncultured bacterium (gcode 4)]|uniref:Uncharacterized protein n=1 Tax=uncultured bacterium (gcode 4) TaxID=1234023 RepID=K1YIP7_9BACT|nr:MAG: hypothetical protein ACD_80C00092G0003 [uncultured bacterium (gcode 4)]HBB04485.1 hypothetical protein [Candidatus Gracilibacteria bacterium]